MSAERWAGIAERVTARAASAGVVTVFPAKVWAAVADPGTWAPGPVTDPTVGWARLLTGRPSRLNPPPRRPGAPERGSTLPADRVMLAVAFWQGDPVLWAHRHRERLGEAVWLAGLAPHHKAGVGDSRIRAALVRVVRDGFTNLHAPGGAALETVRVCAQTAPQGSPEWAWARAVMRLVEDPRAPVAGDDATLSVEVPGAGAPVTVRFGGLGTYDPRLARRFLEIFDWRGWLGDPGTATGPRAAAVRDWLAAVAPADRAAAHLLADHLRVVDPRYLSPAYLALRAAGHPVRWPLSDERPAPEPLAAPVLWWRRMLGRLVSHPDRPRAVEEIEAAWVWLCTGGP